MRGAFRLRSWIGRLVRGKGYSTEGTLAGGERLRLDLDDWIQFRVFLTGRYDIETIHEAAMLGKVRRGMTIFDVGSHVGYYALQFATRVGPEGAVHAFEPVASTNALLAANVERNGLTNVTVNRMLVSEKAGHGVVYSAPGDNVGRASRSHLEGFEQSEEVPMTTFDDYARERSIPKVDLVKIDVEGGEFAVLKGMTRLLATSAPLIFVEINRPLLEVAGTTANELRRFLAGFGYACFLIRPDGLVETTDLDSDESLVHFMKPAGSGARAATSAARG